MTSEQWQVAEAEYVSGSSSAKELAERFGVCEDTVVKHARDALWRLKRKSVRSYLGGSLDEMDEDLILSSGGQILQAAFKTRMSDILDHLLCSMKTRTCSGGENTSLDRARDVRTMDSLIKMLDRLHDTDNPDSEPAREDWLKYDDDAIYDWLSREIDEAKRVRDPRTS
ncbi:MAG: hypothetical protein ACR2OJ_16345 [Hyphomicrobiales bacterium]